MLKGPPRIPQTSISWYYSKKESFFNSLHGPTVKYAMIWIQCIACQTGSWSIQFTIYIELNLCQIPCQIAIIIDSFFWRIESHTLTLHWSCFKKEGRRVSVPEEVRFLLTLTKAFVPFQSIVAENVVQLFHFLPF